MLAEDGVIDLDLPVRTYVPELRLPDPVIAERATIRDLLSHRTGLDWHDHAWIFNPSWSRDECVRRMEHLPLAADLRVKMQYSNFGYTLAGLAMERATGSSYEDQLTKRVLEAAGMTRATASFDRTIADPDHAEPYRLVDDVALRTEFRLMPATEPAGAVRSCADDTAKWLLVQLGHGPLPADVVRRTHDLHIATADLQVPWPEVRLYGYALGWAVATYRGRPMLWHTGGIDGFFTYTLLLPEDDIGVAASVNVLEAPLSQAVVWDVVDALLGESAERAWTDRLHPDTLKAEAAAAQGEQPTPAAPDPRPADPALPVHALDAYVGRFSNGGYGDLVVAEVGAFGALWLQVKGTAHLDSEGRVVAFANYAVDAIPESPRLLYLVCLVDLQQHVLARTWLIPSAEFNRLAYREHSKRPGRVSLQFSCVASADSRWDRFAVPRLQLGARLAPLVAALGPATSEELSALRVKVASGPC